MDSSHSADYRRVLPIAGWINSNKNSGCEHDDDGGDDGDDDDDVRTHVLRVPNAAPKESRKIKRKVVPCANSKNYGTNHAYAVNLPKRTLDVNPKKVCHSNEDTFEDQWRANSKVVGTSEAGRRMFVPTDVRVLNESYVTTAIATPRPDMLDSAIPASRTSHVKAALPLAGNSTVATSWKNFHQGNAFSHNLERESENFDCHSLITNGDLDKGSETQETKIRLNKALTRSSGLDKLREKIKQQQLVCKEHSSSKITESSAHVEKTSLASTTNEGDVDMVPETDCPSSAVDSSDSVCRASQSCDYNNNGLVSTYTSKKTIQNNKNNHAVKTRKIAASVSTPSYKGFSRLKEKNTENVSGARGKVKRTDAKSATTTTGKAVTRTKMKKAAKTQEIRENSKPKAARAVCRTNEIDIITPSSWKKGHEVVLRILGSKPKVQPAKTKPGLQIVDLQTIPAKLPQTAREMIEDLQLGRQTDTCINGNHEYESKTFERPKTKEKEFDKPPPILSILKRKPKFTVLDSEKQPKVRHYDPEEVRKFIAKKKTERVQKARENQEALHNEFIKRQERLQEVYRKQKESTALIMRKENIYPSKKPLKESMCFDMSMFDSEDSTAVSAKAKVSENSEDSTEETEEGSTTSKTSPHESMSDQLSQDSDAAYNKCSCHLPRTHSLQNPAADRKSSDYFYHSLLSTNKPVNPLVPGPISRTQLVTRQWSADLNRLHDLRESAATLTHKIKEMCQTSNFPISSSNIVIPEEEPVFAGTKTDQSLPGVQNIQQKAAEIFDKKEKDAATCIQAVYRGYTVRKNLHWQRLTGQTDFSEKANLYLERNSVSSSDEAQKTPPRSKVKGKLCFENISASSDEMTTPPQTTDFPNPTSRFKNLHCDYTELLRGNEVDEHISDNSQEMDTSWLCKPASSRYPWKKNDMPPDKYSVVNIFTSKYRTCNNTETEDSAQQETPSLENSQPKPLISSLLHLNTNDLNVPPPQHHRPTSQLLENIHSGLPRLKAPTAFSVNPSVSLDTFERNNSCKREMYDVMATASLISLPSQKISLVGGESKEIHSDKLPEEIHTSSRIKSSYSVNPVIQTNGDCYGLQDLHSSSSCGDSEAENQSTIEMSSQILSSVGDGTDSDVSSLQNDLPSKSMCPYQSQFPAIGGYSTKEGDPIESPMKKYSPAQLPMKLRAELYNWEQTVESISLAQQETFSLGRIFQTQSQNPEPNLHYLEQMRRAMAMLDNNTTSRVPPAEPVISSPEHSDHSGVLKSIMAEDKQPASQKSFSHYHSLNSTVTSQNTRVSKETSVSDDQPASGTQFKHKAARHSSSIPSASISSHLPQKRHSHRASSQRSSSNFIKTLSDAKNHSDSSSGTVTEDISASSGTEASSTSQPSKYLTKTSSSSKRRVLHNKENLPSKKLNGVTRKDLSEAQETANSIQHHGIMKGIEEILPQLSKKKQNIVTEVPRVMAEFQLLTAQQESERRAYYAKMKKFFTSKETPESEKANSNKNKSKSDSEVSKADTQAANTSDSLQFHIENLQQKTLTETCLGLYTLEKRLKYESKELYRLRKAAEKSCEDKVIQQSRDSSAKEGRHHERPEKAASRRRHENASTPAEESYASTITPSWKEKNSASSKLGSTSKTLHHTASGSSSSSGSSSKATSSISEELSNKHLSSSIGESIGSKNKSQKTFSGSSNSAANSKSIPEAIKTLSGLNGNDISHSSSIKDKIKSSNCESGENTPITEEYSHTFETSVNNSLKTSLRQLLSPLVGSRNNSFSFRSSCQKRRGSESDTEDSFHSETLSDVSDIEVRIRALSEDLKKKKAEADRLRRERRNKHREKLKAQEESLVKQIEAYDRYINQANEDLQREQETLQRNVVVKPQIKQPKVLESRRFRQQSPPDVSSSKLSLSQSRDSTGSSADEALSSPLSPMKSEFHEAATCSVALTPRPLETGSCESEKSPPGTSIKASIAEEIAYNNISQDIVDGSLTHSSQSLVGMKDSQASLKQPSDDADVQLGGKMDAKNVVGVSEITEKGLDKKVTESTKGDFSSTSKGLESSLSTEISESISEEISSAEMEGSGKSKDASELAAGITPVVAELPSPPLPTTSPPPSPPPPPSSPPLPSSSPPPSSPASSPPASPPASPPPPPSSSPPPPPTSSPPPPPPSSSPPPPPPTSSPPPPPPTSSPPPPPPTSSSPPPPPPSSSPPPQLPSSPPPPPHSLSLPPLLSSAPTPLSHSVSEAKPSETTKSKDLSERHDDSSTLSGHYYSDDFEVDKSWTSHPSHCSESAAGHDAKNNETTTSLRDDNSDDNTDDDISEQIPVHSETSNSSRSYPLKLSLGNENFVKEDVSVNGNRSVALVMSEHVDIECGNETESERNSGDNVYEHKKVCAMNVDTAAAHLAWELFREREMAADAIDVSEKLPVVDDSSESEKIHEAGGTTSGSEEASESKTSWQESEKEGVSETRLQESEKERESKMKWQAEEKGGEFETRWQASKKEVVSKTSLQESEKEGESKTRLQESELEKECEPKMRLQESEKEDVSKTSLQESEKEGESNTTLQESEKEGESKARLQESELEKESEPKMRLQESEKEDVSKTSLQESEKEGESNTTLQESEKEGESKARLQESELEKECEPKMRLQESEKKDVSKTSLQESEKEGESKARLQESEKELESKMKWQEPEKEGESKTSWQEQEEESQVICESKKTDQTVCDSEKADKAICDSASVPDEETSPLTASPKSVNATQTTTTTSVTGGDVAEMKELQRATATDVTARKDVMAELQDSPETPTEKKVSRNEYVEKLVCDLVGEFVSQSITTVCEVVANRKQTMAQSKGALAKPKRKSLSLGNQSVAGKVSPPATAKSAWEKSPESGFNTQQQYFVDEMVASLVDNAVGNIVDIHNRKLSAASPSASPGKKGKVSIDLGKVTTQRGSHFEQSSSFEEDLFVWTLSPESESSDDLGTADVEDADKMENVSRPHSPLPSHMKKTPDSADTDDFFGDFDLTPYKPPPPYPGSKENDTIAKPELLKITKEYYAVPHKREEIQQLVSDAVEILWENKQKCIQLQDIALPETFLSVTENLSTDFDEYSCRSYKAMLFDLTREIVSEIYEDKCDKSNKLHKSDQEDQSEGVFAQLLLQNSQLNINKYYRTHSKPPACLDELQQVVEKAISSLLHLDGEAVPCGSSSRGHEFDKWKTSKKDHVDRILVQELQDEEPQWVNYDSDELQLKLQLTNSIMDSLIGNTVDTFKHIYNKHSQWQPVQL